MDKKVHNSSDDFSLVLGGPFYQLLRRSKLAGDHLELAHRKAVALANKIHPGGYTSHDLVSPILGPAVNGTVGKSVPSPNLRTYGPGARSAGSRTNGGSSAA